MLAGGEDVVLVEDSEEEVKKRREERTNKRVGGWPLYATPLGRKGVTYEESAKRRDVRWRAHRWAGRTEPEITTYHLTGLGKPHWTPLPLLLRVGC